MNSALLALLGARVAASAPLTIDYLTYGYSAANATSYTFPGLSFGAEAEGRQIIAAVCWGGDGANYARAGTLGGLTIGGVAATLDVSGTVYGGIGRATVSGVSGDVVVTISGATPGNCFVALWRANRTPTLGDTTAVAPTSPLAVNRSVMLTYDRDATATNADASVEAERIGARYMRYVAARGAQTLTSIGYAPALVAANYS